MRLGDAALRGLWQLASGRGSQARLSVLTFHRVTELPDPLFPGEMHAERFDRLCAILARTANVLPLDEAVRLLCAGRLPARALSISFDDGYADNHDQALPILRRHGLCATFFISTGFIGGGCMWNDRVIEAVRRARVNELDLEDWQLGRIGLPHIEARRAAIATLLRAFKYMPLEQRLARCTALAERAGVALPDDLMMSWSQVCALAEQGMQIGAHTVDHPILATLSDEQVGAQIAGSKAELERQLGQSVTLFAYPNGRWGQDVDERVVSLLRPMGFAAAVTTEAGAARHDCDPLRIPRFTPWDEHPRRFVLRLALNCWQRRRAGLSD